MTVALMAETSHTPGPWFLFKPGSACIESPSGNIAVTNLARASLADARLIAAAPELLALCREMENWLRPEVTEEPDRTYFWKLVEVIRKAEGKTPLFVEVKS
jgi:hypothetical protein